MRWLLAIMALILAAVVTFQWHELTENPGISLPRITPPETSSVVDNAEGQPEYDLAPLSEFEEIFERPLFSATRKPPEPEIEEPEEEEKKEPEVVNTEPFPAYLKLKAIWAVENQMYAMVENSKEKSTSRLKVGDKLEDWQVAEIHADSARFRAGDVSETLKLWVYAKLPVASKKPKNALKEALLKRRAQQKAQKDARQKQAPKAKQQKFTPWS